MPPSFRARLSRGFGVGGKTAGCRGGGGARAMRRGRSCGTRDDIEELITVDEAPELIDHNQPIAVAIECDTGGGAHAGDRQLQELRMKRAAAIVDVAAVRRAADRYDFRAQVREHARSDLVRGAIRAVDDNLEPGEVHALRHGCGTELL